MSTTDDILFAPINKNTSADFQLRKNVQGTWDWKPLTERAHKWMLTYFSLFLKKDSDGYIVNFAPLYDMHSDPVYHLFQWWKELQDGNYGFTLDCNS